MENLVIIGAGGFGREVLMMAIDNPETGRRWNIKGFLDDRPGILDGYSQAMASNADAIEFDDTVRQRYRRDFPVLGSPMDYVPEKGDVFICAVGSPAERRRYAEPILQKGGQFTRLIHPQAAASVYANAGIGCIVGPFASLSPDCRLGRFVTVSSYTAIAHDVDIGDWSEIGGHCLIAGRVRIGEAVRVHPGSILTTDVRVGDRAVIAAGSVVFGNIREGTTVLGNPARKFDWAPRQN
jgi:sugar O-acyltransferase (sialic acid O-acetyltransferase NeuD family)